MKWRLYDNTDTIPNPAGSTKLVFGDQTMLIEGDDGKSPPIYEAKPLPLAYAVESPATTSTQTGAFKIKGWATMYDPAKGAEQVMTVRLTYKDIVQGVTGNYGQDRPGVTPAEYKNTKIGFEFDWDANLMQDGPNIVKLQILQFGGVLLQEIVLNITVPASNVPSELHFIVDKPVMNGRIQDKYTFTGWASQRDDAANKENVQSIEVLFNGVSQGNVAWGKPRPDVLLVFPSLKNPNTGWEWEFDTAGLPNGKNLFSFIVKRLKDGNVQHDHYATIMTQSTEPMLPNIETPATPPAPPKPTPIPEGNAKAISGVNFRTTPDSSITTNVIRKIAYDEVVTVVKFVTPYWMQIRDKNNVLGYGHKDYFNFTTPSASLLGDSIIIFGMQYEGRQMDGITPKYDYGFGADAFKEGDKTFDCSSFTQWVMKQVCDITLPRASAAQAKLAGGKFVKITKLADLKKGDIMFWDNGDRNNPDKQKANGGTRDDPYDNYVDHVGICAADGGAFVLHTFREKVGVCYMDINTTISSKDNKSVIASTYWKSNFLYGMRPITSAGTGFVKL
jgi:NlpC/P60 family protein